MNEMNAWYAFYIDRHLTCFPLYGITNGKCRCPKGEACTAAGKHPKGKWKGEPSRLPQALDNIGVSTDNLVVLDFDGLPIEAVDEYPQTFTTSTGHGFHAWYFADPAKKVKSQVKWKRKIDIRAKGGLIVAPPSTHRSGIAYAHVRGDTIEPVPADLLAELPEQRGHTKSATYPHQLRDITPDCWSPLATSLVERIEAETKGSRNAELFKVACDYYRAAQVGILGADVLEELFRAACATGLEPDEVHRTIDSARRSV